MSFTKNTTEPYRIQGQFNINDVKYDLLKIIHPYDGYMYNEKDTVRVNSLFKAYLSDLKYSNKIFSYEIQNSEKENAVTFDVHVTMQKDRSAKKLKIHIGKLVYPLQVA
jgi:uncharacterized Fe-S radical SAM superfamily protein PflX